MKNIKLIKKNEKPLVSVIVPVFNVEKSWVEKCIDSIVNQSYTNLEILLVDDGNSPEYVDFGGKVNETFVAYKDITIDGGTDVSQSLMLKRITSMFMLRINDVQPSNIASVDFLLTGASTNFNPSTGLSYSTSATVRTIHVDVSSFAGKTNVELFFHMFLPTDAATVTIVANFMDADGNTLLTKQFSPVEMGVNEKTIYSGNIYSQERSYMVDVDDTWRRTNEISF